MSGKADETGGAPRSYFRMGIGGALMGIANLIPGVSGGTMILAMGLYTEFIESVADLTAFRFRRRPIIFLGVIGACALLAIVGLADAILYLLFHYDTAMYALFIGLTLGGAPALLRSLRPMGIVGGAFTLIGIGAMIAITLAKGGREFPANPVLDVIYGTVAAMTMVLPGISGSYMLLILGQYDRIVGSIPDRNLLIIVPVGVGVVAGVVLLSNTLKYLLHRFQRHTIGFLLGMLLGSVIGLWPFGRQPSNDALERGTTPELVQLAEIKGVSVDEGLDHEGLVEHIRAYWSTRRTDHDYSAASVVGAVLFAAIGFVVTSTLSRNGTSLGTRDRDHGVAGKLDTVA